MISSVSGASRATAYTTAVVQPAAAVKAPGTATDEEPRQNEEVQLSERAQARQRSLEQRDRQVRRHEQAHISAAGGYAGSPTYQYETGPDNRRYAVGGEVSIDASPITGDPEATITKMRIVQSAALAPTDPSGQDRRVAAKAATEILEASQELQRQRDAARVEYNSNPGKEVGEVIDLIA